MSDSEDHVDPIDDAGDDDLFGDDDDAASAQNILSDRDLASDAEDDRDAGRHARATSQDEAEYKEKTVLNVPLYRHRIPKSQDDSVRVPSMLGGYFLLTIAQLVSFRVPDFVKLNPVEYKPDTWEPSKWEMDNATADTPVPVVLSRRDQETRQMQSNSNICRWSDGSVTIAIGDDHYEIQSKPLAPPPDKEYQEVQDTHYYAAAAHLTTNSLLIIGHFTEQYTVRPNEEGQDHALERLKAQMAVNKREKTEIIGVATEDPELHKKQAELAEKERLKAQRRREAAAARATDGAAGRYKGGSGLSVGDLEGGRRGAAAASGRKRGAPGAGKKKHRRPEYDSDDDLPRGARREDNYDMEDGFLVDSEDESDGGEDEEDEELVDDDEEEEEAPRKRRKTAEVEEADADEDANQGAEGASRRRRRVVDDDDEE